MHLSAQLAIKMKARALSDYKKTEAGVIPDNWDAKPMMSLTS
jgi:hypothetical protein